jgi:hypothetical protein
LFVLSQYRNDSDPTIVAFTDTLGDNVGDSKYGNVNDPSITGVHRFERDDRALADGLFG